MPDLPIYIDLLFIATVAATFLLFLKTTYFSKKLIIILLSWMIAQGMLAFKGFYLDSNIFPPRFMFTIIPPVIVIILLFTTKKGKVWVDGLNIKWLTWIHIVRIPVELALYLISLHQLIPTLMTFEGRNYDIISGITTPFIYYFTLKNNGSKKKLLLIWNVVCLGLLINIVVLAILSAPSPYQKFAFDQPNRALYYFPFIWLSSVIVPLVLFSHLASIRKLAMELKKEKMMKKEQMIIN
jgi:hypothetical protein